MLQLKEVTASKLGVKSVLGNTDICMNFKEKSETEINLVRSLLQKSPGETKLLSVLTPRGKRVTQHKPESVIRILSCLTIKGRKAFVILYF